MVLTCVGIGEELSTISHCLRRVNATSVVEDEQARQALDEAVHAAKALVRRLEELRMNVRMNAGRNTDA